MPKLLFILAFICNTLAWSQLHLILGKPNTLSPTLFAASTAEVTADGAVVLGETLIDPEKQQSFRWFDIDYDSHQAYLMAGTSTAIVLDLNSNSVAKRCPIPSSPGKRSIYLWRIDDPNLGQVFVSLRGRGDVSQNFLFGFLADPERSCSDSSLMLHKDQVAFFVTGGQAGVGGTAAQSLFHAHAFEGRIIAAIGLDLIPFPIPFDPSQIKEFNAVAWNVVGILARNRLVEAMAISANTQATGSFWARERPTGTWIRLPIPVGQDPNIRAFGSVLAWPESVYAEFQESAIKADPRLARIKAVPAGESEWRKNETKWGVSIEFEFTHSATIHTGVLHIFDVKTQRHFQIRTGQSDSEVLLIQDGLVYYRSSDRLFRAEISGDQLTGIKQIAQSELIRDAHWGFTTKTP